MVIARVAGTLTRESKVTRQPTWPLINHQLRQEPSVLEIDIRTSHETIYCPAI